MTSKLQLKPAQLLLLTLAATFCGRGHAQSAPDPPAPPPAAQPAADKPLPDINNLMRQVEARERLADKIHKSYLYRETRQMDHFDSHEAVKKTETHESEIFWLNGVRVERTLKKDGKTLSPDELKKENERIDKEVARAQERHAKDEAEGKDPHPHSNDDLTFARILELGAFSNPRRQTVNGRDTILVDYTGDPKAKTHNIAEGIFRELAGTVWIDEQDHVIEHVEGHFMNDFKVGGGLVASVRKGTWFKATTTKVNDEVWFPKEMEGSGQARYLLFFSINGHLRVTDGDFRKFKATSTVLPTFTAVEPDAPAPVTPSPPVPPPPPADFD